MFEVILFNGGLSANGRSFSKWLFSTSGLIGSLCTCPVISGTTFTESFRVEPSFSCSSNTVVGVLISSPFILAGTIAFHLNKEGTETARLIQENLYVDNVIYGSDTVDEAITLYTESKELFKKASMNLREWSSNSTELLRKDPKRGQIEEQ